MKQVTSPAVLLTLCRTFRFNPFLLSYSLQAGLVTGAVTLAALSFVSVSCMLMIVDCKNIISRGAKGSHVVRDADSLSFGALADELLGPRGKFWADITVVFTQLAFGTAYIIYAGSNCGLVAQTYGYATSPFHQNFISVVFRFSSACWQVFVQCSRA